MIQGNKETKVQTWTVLHMQCFLIAEWEAALPDSLGSECGYHPLFQFQACCCLWWKPGSYQVISRDISVLHPQGWGQSAYVCSVPHWVVLQVVQVEHTWTLNGLGCTPHSDIW